MTAPIRFDDLVPKQKAPAARRQAPTASFDDLIPKQGQPIDLAEEEARSVERVAQQPKTLQRMGLAAAQGLPFVGTWTDELLGKKAREELAAFREESPRLAYGTEIGTGLLTGGGLAAFSKLGQMPRLAKALSSGVAEGIISGAGATDEGGFIGRAVGGATGGAMGALASKLLTPTEKITQRDIARDIAGATVGLGQNVRVAAGESLRNRMAGFAQRRARAVSDVLQAQPSRLVQGIGRAIEPVDVKKTEEVVSQLFPSTLSRDVLETQAAEAKRLAGEMGALTEEATTRAGMLKKKAGQRFRKIEQSALKQGERDAKAVLAQAEEAAGGLIAGVRAGARDTDAVRDWTRQLQLAEGRQSYQAVRAIGAPPEPDPEVYREILADKTLKRGLIKSYNALRREAQNVEPGMPIREDLRRVTVGGRNVPEVSLEMFDNIRRHIFDQPVMSKVNATGISASERRRLLQQVDRLEERFLSGYGTSDAAEAIRAARQQYRARFEELEALRDGLMLGTATAGKTPKLLMPNRMQLDVLTRRVETYPPNAQGAFQVGAAKWFDNLAADNPKSAVRFLEQMTGSESDRKRLRLAFGDEVAEQMIVAAQGRSASIQAGKQTVARGQKIAKEAKTRLQGRAATAQAEAEMLAQALRGRQAQAAELEGTLDAATRLRTALGTTPTAREAQEGFMETLMPTMGAGRRQAIQQYGTAEIRRQIAGMTPEQARRRLQELQQNPVAMRLFAPQITDALRGIQPGPRVLRPAVSRFLGGAVGGAFGRQFAEEPE